tara:strand:+ start:304 stop:552 length:249 start_codon:yes stop_codon:yes gene_type:complete
MSTLTLELDTQLARSLEESARREHKPLEAWACERLRLAAMETAADANGYPTGWLRLFASIEDETFVAPSRSDARPVAPLDQE